MKYSLSLSRTRRRRGYTLIELMISLVAGSIVVIAAWRISRISSQIFNQGTQRSDTQGALRHATEVLRRHISRAGYLSIRDALVDVTNCGGTTPATLTNQPAVSITTDAAGRQVLFVTGTYLTGHQVKTWDATSNVLTIDATHDVFRSAFVDPATNAVDGNEVTRVFGAVGAGGVPRWVSVSTNNNIFLSAATLAPYTPPGNPVLTLATALPTPSACLPARTQFLVAPLTTYRFALEDPSASPDLARLVTAGQFVSSTGGTRLMLVRREIDMSTRAAAGGGTPIPGTAEVVLDFVNSWSIGAVLSDNALPPTLTFNRTPQALPQQQQTNIRSLVIDLVADGPILTGQVDSAERLRRLQNGRRFAHFEVFMPNMTRPARGISP